MKYLTNLYLSNGRISEIDLQQNTQLETVYLDSNELTKLSRNSLPAGLKLANFSKNRITTIDPATFNDAAKLETVILDHNNISRLHTGTFNNKNLKVLNLSGNKLHEIDPGVFSGSGVRYLYLQHNNLRNLLPDMFSKNVKVLNVSCNDVAEIKSFAFRGMREVEEVYLGGNKTKVLGNMSFYGLEKVVDLDLSNLGVADVEAGAFFGLSSLIRLNLKGNSITVVDDNSFNELESLEMLDLSRNSLRVLLKDSFTGTVGNFQKLFLSHNQLETIPLGAFKEMTSLKELHLNNNKLKSLQIGTFSSLINLQLLNLSHNNLTDLQPLSLFPLRSLSQIIISQNNILQIDYTSITSHLTKLTKIDLAKNPWDCKPLTSMLQYLEEHGVDFSSNTTNYQYYTENVHGIGCSIKNETTNVTVHSSGLMANLFDTVQQIKSFCVLLSVLLGFILFYGVYKHYLSQYFSNKHCRRRQHNSEIELLSA